MNADEVDENQRQTDGQAGEVVRSAVGLRCSAEHYQHEQTGEHNLHDQAIGSTEGAGISTCGGGDDDARIGGYDACEHSSGKNGTDDLEQHVHAAVLSRDASVQEYTQRDGGVDVATRDAADGVGHSDDRQTEGHSGSDDCCSVLSTTTQGYSCATAEECKHECAN